MTTAVLTVHGEPGRSGWSQPRTLTPDRVWVIGRAHDADIVIDDGRVSRRHLVVQRTGAGWVIRDVSSNGSWQDGARMGREGVSLPAGGELRVNLGDRAGPEIRIIGGTRADPSRYGGAGLADAPTAQSAPPVQPVRSARRTRRRTLIAAGLVGVTVLLVIADRVAARLASTAAVGQVVQQSQGLKSKPSVSFGGFPFLTQVGFGNYTDISVGIDDVATNGGPRIAHVSGHLRGVHIPMSKAISGDVTKVPIDHVTATVDLGFTDLNAYLAKQPGHLKLAQSKGVLQVSGNVELGGTTIDISGSARLQVDDGQLDLSPTDLRPTSSDDLLAGLATTLGTVLSSFPAVPVPLPDLPFHLRLTAVRTTSAGLVVSAAADHLVLETSQK